MSLQRSSKRDTDPLGLVGTTLTAIEHEEPGHPWYFRFGPTLSLMCECMWRLVVDGSVALASDDDGQQFGLPRPLDCLTELRARVSNHRVTSAAIGEAPADLTITFANGAILECLVDSSGYEAWSLTAGKRTLISLGGGRLSEFS